MDADKLPDEKFEHRKASTVEEGVGDFDDATVKKVLWKMDIRYYITTTFFFPPFLSFATYLVKSFPVADTKLRILPVLALLFLCSFIDRTNVGNAKILGLETDIHINDHQYAIGLCVFYATYIARYVVKYR